MKRSTIIYLAFFLVIGTLAAVLLINQEKNTLPEEGRDFAYQDTAAVTRIVMTDQNDNRAVLERKSKGTWFVNEKYEVKERQIDILLETINRVTVKHPVPIAARDNVIRMMTTSAIKVEVFKGDENVKTFYVGGPTPDELGTMMLINGAPDPYITHIPGFNGYLTPRFFVGERDWRTTELYDLNPAAIEEVSVEYHFNPEASFKVKVKENNFLISPLDGPDKEVKINSLAAKRYLAGFRDMYFEQFVDLDQNKIDSIINTQPAATIAVRTPQKDVPHLTLYFKKVDERTKGINEAGFDIDKYYGQIGEQRSELVLVQQFVIGKLLTSFEELASMPAHAD